MNDPNIANAASFESKELNVRPGFADIWNVPLETGGRVLDDLRRILSSDEQQRALRFHAVEHQELFVAGRGILRQILSCYLRVQPESLIFRYGAKGKPDLEGPPGLHFNLGHSGGRAVYAVAADRVGVDIELVQLSRDWQKISQRFFSPREAEELASLDPSRQISGFFACWTRKEAYIKAVGDGLAIPLNKFYVGANPVHTEGAIEIDIDADTDKEKLTPRWYFKDLKLGEPFAGTIVTRFPECRIRCFNFDRAEDCLSFVNEARRNS
ncbi:MAG: 4'-phosphopantetheinyl transferase family protein [Terriglobales bacterium]